MGNIIFQIIAQDGRIKRKEVDWSTDQACEMLFEIENTLNVQPDESKVFVVIDMYSEVKKKHEKKESNNGRMDTPEKNKLQEKRETYEVQSLWCD